jgi:hypothetical protein
MKISGTGICTVCVISLRGRPTYPMAILSRTFARQLLTSKQVPAVVVVIARRGETRRPLICWVIRAHEGSHRAIVQRTTIQQLDR